MYNLQLLFNIFKCVDITSCGNFGVIGYSSGHVDMFNQSLFNIFQCVDITSCGNFGVIGNSSGHVDMYNQSLFNVFQCVDITSCGNFGVIVTALNMWICIINHYSIYFRVLISHSLVNLV